MRIIFMSGLLALASRAFSDVTYSVIGFPDAKTNTYAVEIDKEMYNLQTSEATFPLWSANVADVSASSGYRYVQLNNKDDVVVREKFLRHFTNNDATATLNEFFNRQTTITTLPSIKQVYKDTRPKPSKAFDSSQIATIHLTADPDTFSDMMKNPLDEKRKAIKAGFKFINTDTVYSVGEVSLKVSGHGSRKNKKVSLRIKFDDDKGETFFDRSVIKLRAQYIDPTMIREKLYIDILNAVGVSSYQGSYVRVYVNGKPHGFYLMVEDIEEPSFVSTIHHGDKKALGSLFQMGSGHKATMVYKGPRTANYDPMVYENKIRGDNPKDEPMQQFIAFMKDLKDWNPAAAGGVAYWNQRLDLDGYLRSMALEYLAGAWDSFWWRGNNYFMYFNPQRKVWQFIPTDFDHTFTSDSHPDVDTTYKKFAQSRLRNGSKNHPLVTKLIYKNKDINKQFENTLLTISRGVFNNKALDARINAYETQIKQDVAWDFSIDRSKQPGENLDWKITDFHNAIKGPVKNVPDGIKPWIASRAKSVPGQIGK
ncbi:MAG: coth protein-domain-containing protein [Linnemannia gamsii]|nr:MAG: coth protein-domain-containing protein [Linnemannia gamsii]